MDEEYAGMLRFKHLESLAENSNKLRKLSSNFKGDLISNYTSDDLNNGNNDIPFEMDLFQIIKDEDYDRIN